MECFFYPIDKKMKKENRFFSPFTFTKIYFKEVCHSFYTKSVTRLKFRDIIGANLLLDVLVNARDFVTVYSYGFNVEGFFIIIFNC